ncbi:type VII secretion-associated serine protease mycosin [Actinoplanes philippinensis]|uniref:Type VII secretion-associated serine protease mycosin n=1 Tax=Actinoplanes philippinensis TaxID=35752 RepID=A0A1I2HX44_9ACTN|nr:type VII secretion-associated serine protease mycosin [Actinoplanes philippinensis]SFF34599.1 type VII secretion-associated serine protease mycosin [Actinoplanes philippinensis]
MAAVAAGVVAGGLVAPALPAVAAQCLGAGTVAAGVPGELRAYSPERLAGLATGAGVRVAVIDSGVDVRHPQLTGRVAAGRDLLHGAPDGRRDCVGHGTAVAGIIAGLPDGGTGVRGLAPGATIIPVRVTEDTDTRGQQQIPRSRSSADTFAEAIRWAAGPAGADVINISLVMDEPDPAVRDAIAAAVRTGAVVVAAAGNGGADAPVAYPAGFPGVVGVGAVTADGVLADYSQPGTQVDIAAFGDQVTVLSPVRGHRAVQGTSFAAPFVSATAALLRERYPADSAEEIVDRLLRSADPAPGGARSARYGVGLLNPYRALTEAAGPVVAAVPEGPVAPVAAPGRDTAWQRAGVFTAGGAALAVLAGLVAVVVSRGRRRGWRAAADTHRHDQMPG